MGHGREFESDVREPMKKGDFYWPAMVEPAPEDLKSRPCPSEEFLRDWLVRTCEIVDRYQPSILYFDWWIQHEAFKPWLKLAAAYYYNRGCQWGLPYPSATSTMPWPSEPGFRRWSGARIANGLRTAGVKNPVMLLDEIDKVSTDYKGDTFSALLEVLDNEQNHKFRDHYLEVPLDLSEVLFITTANTLQTIPRPLLDRMEVIEISSYTENEKLHIAEEHLIPKQIEKHGLTPKQITFSKHSIWKIARNYTKEAGVRQLEREIGNVCRKAAKEIFTTERKKIAVTDRNIHRFLGKEKYTYQMANIAAEVGIVRDLHGQASEAIRFRSKSM